MTFSWCEQIFSPQYDCPHTILIRIDGEAELCTINMCKLIALSLFSQRCCTTKSYRRSFEGECRDEQIDDSYCGNGDYHVFVKVNTKGNLLLIGLSPMVALLMHATACQTWAFFLSLISENCVTGNGFLVVYKREVSPCQADKHWSQVLGQFEPLLDPTTPGRSSIRSAPWRQDLPSFWRFSRPYYGQRLLLSELS